MTVCPVTGQDPEDCACYTHTILDLTDDALSDTPDVDAFSEVITGLIATMGVVIASDPCRHTRSETLADCLRELEAVVERSVEEWRETCPEYDEACDQANRLN